VESIGLTNAYGIGGSTVLTDKALEDLRQVGLQTTRSAAGADAYATASSFAALSREEGWASGEYVGLADRARSADSLAAAGSVGSSRGALLFTTGSTLPSSTRNAIAAFSADRSIRVFGNTRTVTSSVLIQAGSALPDVTISTPSAPSSMRRTRSYSVSGYLKPRHTPGARPVRVYRWRYVNRTWKSYGYVWAKASNYSTYTKYSCSMRLPYAGRWRVRAYHPEDSQHAGTWSRSYDYVTVK
ncbi:MAG: hypothetical protein HY876_09695, partial [Coriobacteriales bacterium]|nr:hypothetical protein [Coriobacteriales bacterium]